MLGLHVRNREPRGFGFVQYMDPGDAAEAQYHMDHQVINGREITVVFAEENRKKPQEMRSKERIRYGVKVRIHVNFAVSCVHEASFNTFGRL